jgi:YfiR/HmsC-like
MAGAPMTRTRRRFLFTCVMAFYAWCTPALVTAQEFVVENPNKVKAAFLRNFAHYVVWPAEAFADANDPWCIGVLGPDPFGAVLDRILQGRTEQGRPFIVYRADVLERLPRCQIVYITYADSAWRRAALAALKGKPVLTVGDAPSFLQEGGIIRLAVDDHVRMSINLDAARADSLKIQTKMLEVAVGVLENGKMHEVR